MTLRSPLAIAIGALALQGCGEPLAVAPHNDVDRARADWIAQRPANYTYEVKTLSMTGPTSRRITVRNSVATETVNTATGVITPGGMTIEDIWTQILAERQNNQLHSATFDSRGIPLTSDMGFWPADGGRSYTITGFIPF